MSKYLGLVVLRLTDSLVLPMNTTQYVLELESYVDKYFSSYMKKRLYTHFSRISGLKVSQPTWISRSNSSPYAKL